MSARKIAFVMEQTLGNVTHYLNLRHQEASSAALITPRWLPIQYAERPTQPWALTGSWRAHQALEGVLSEVDGGFVHTITLALLGAFQFRKKPTVLSSDGTSINKIAMREAYGLRPDGALLRAGKRFAYREILRRAAGVVAWSAWVKDSFINDYGCKEEDVVVIPPGVAVDAPLPAPPVNELPRILFIGGEFERKGGELLLSIYRRRLRDRARLVIVTQAAHVVSEPGVEVHHGVSPNSAELRRLLATSDLFVLPTRADCFPMGCLEALAAGLPVVSTRVGGIPDLVKPGVTGYLAESGDEGALGDAMEELVTNRELRQRMGKAGREDVVARFDTRETSRRLYEYIASRCS